MKTLDKLAAQAGLHTDWFIDNPEIERFAELIIQEVCDGFVELRTRPADLASKDVKNCFGVRE